MVKIEQGGEYTASIVKRGRKDGGDDWQFIVVKDENPKSRVEVKLWVQSPAAIEPGSMFRVDSVSALSFYMQQYNGAWLPKVTANVEISPLMSYPEYSAMCGGFTELMGDDDELPY